MQGELYADAIGEITVTGTVVRLDLVSLSATMRDDMGQPVPEHRQRIVMSLEGFANSFDVLQKAMAGLIEAGAIRRNDDVVVPVASGKANGSAHHNASPNFV
ncbi:hypothetical protein WH87_08095 [Devosia epidermidihirudinis]|uniref:Uncharacterized protein n=1 Tax=Devosia epidermidihirudinis TaxID=1293439 RepID=A0A0F5QCV4_9HYPH|nr:hypothetical protein [Devosia epidermidihirudinis]KKC38837.1 hypothetical protein WH87_08095 [Devosia epidermidihirudinis]